MLPPTASFRLPLLCPRRTRTLPNGAVRLLRSSGRGDGGWELPPLLAASGPGAGIFPPSRAFSCRRRRHRHRVKFCSFASSRLHGRKGRGEERAAPGNPPESGPAGRGGSPRLPRGVRRAAAPGSAGAERTALGVPRPAKFPFCLPGKPLSWGKSLGGFTVFAAEAG